ncbi:amino acid permease-domain-containing protein [Russula aff. rugulosa BPL654]|nr:amino acid permease-domain-containing protein [Russula aff. rugulosa BPL654]
MFAFLRSSESGLSSDPPGVAHSDNEKDLVNPAESVMARLDSDSNVNPGGLTFEEVILKHFLIEFVSSIGRIIGTGIFSTPSTILNSVGSVGASLLLWVAGFFLSFCGLFIWLEFGTMFPRSGGEKVYLEAVYRRPKYLATVIFSASAIILGFSASNCIVFARKYE